MRGSVIVIVDISGSGDQTTGANLTLLITRLQHDVSTSIKVSWSVGTIIYSFMALLPSSLLQYEAGTLIIRYNNAVLVPSGRFTTSTVTMPTTMPTVELLWWHILLIAVAAAAVTIAVLAVICVSYQQYLQATSVYPMLFFFSSLRLVWSV